MANLTNLPRDLVEEILCRLPVTSLRSIRSTFKQWCTLLKDETFTKKHIAQAHAERKAKGEILAIMLLNFKLYMVSINVHDYSNLSIRTRGNLTSLNNSDNLEINRICHCEGLVLCLTEDYTRFIVWNPYTRETRGISPEPIPAKHNGAWYGYALGYDKSSHKVLRFFHNLPESCLHEIYDLSSNSRRVLDVTPDWEVVDGNHGLSLKGNTYWYAQDKDARKEGVPDFLLCFDFTSERFVPRLSLPFMSSYEDTDTMILSSVRDEQLAVLFHKSSTYALELWVTSKIEPNAVSWSKFLEVDMSPHIDSGIDSEDLKFGSFIVVEEKKAALVFDDYQNDEKYTAFFIGENGYFREVEIGVVMSDADTRGEPFAFSYVPSSLQINQSA